MELSCFGIQLKSVGVGETGGKFGFIISYMEQPNYRELFENVWWDLAKRPHETQEHGLFNIKGLMTKNIW